MNNNLKYQPQTNSGKVTVTVNEQLLFSISDYQKEWGWNNDRLREAQIERTKLTCKTVRG